MLTFQSLSEDATATAIYLVKLESILREIQEAKTPEELMSPIHSFALEHYQHELDMASIRLAGPNANKDQMLAAAETIKAAIEEVQAEKEIAKK